MDLVPPDARDTAKGRGGSKPSDTNGLWIAAIVVGFFAIPILADMNPTLINGFLMLVLFSSLLLNRDVWLPYMKQLERATK